MHHLRFMYQQKLHFETAIKNHQFVYHCVPNSESRQEITSLHVNISPCDFWAFGSDGFKNKTIYGAMKEAHSSFLLKVTGEAITNWENYDSSFYDMSIMLQQTSFTKPGVAMENFLKKIAPYIENKKENYGKACELMDWIYDYFTYTKGVTSIKTSAEDAFTFGKGVCQDYAHVMIGFCRYLHIPARYVSGIMIGEGYSHAWVEIYSNGFWYGFDPTNHLLVDDMYLVFARGRDATDCVINKGTYWGNFQQGEEIKVLLEEIK